MLYKKNPVVVEAVQYTPKTKEECLRFLEEGKAYYASISNEPDIFDGIRLFKSGDTMTIVPGDYIIKGIKGDFYPCDPETFRATYKQVTSLKLVDVLYFVASGLVHPGAILKTYNYEYIFNGEWFTRVYQNELIPLSVDTKQALDTYVDFFESEEPRDVEKIELTRWSWINDEND